MKAAILFDAGADHWDQKDIANVQDNAREIQACLQARGYQTTLIPIKLGEFGWLTRCRKADVVFNLCEGIDGYSKYEDYVVGTLELTDTPYTGCRPWAVAVCHKKHVANTLLARSGVPAAPGEELARPAQRPVLRAVEDDDRILGLIRHDEDRTRLEVRSTGSSALGLPASPAMPSISDRWPPAEAPVIPIRSGSMPYSPA